MNKQENSFVAWASSILCSAFYGASFVVGFLSGAFYPRYLNENVFTFLILLFILGSVCLIISFYANGFYKKINEWEELTYVEEPPDLIGQMIVSIKRVVKK